MRQLAGVRVDMVSGYASCARRSENSIHCVPLEGARRPGINLHHRRGFPPPLPLDGQQILAAQRGRGRHPGAEGVGAELLRIEPGRERRALDHVVDAHGGEALLHVPPLVHRTEDPPLLKDRGFHPGPKRPHRAEHPVAREGDPHLRALPALVGLGPADGDEDPGLHEGKVAHLESRELAAAEASDQAEAEDRPIAHSLLLVEVAGGHHGGELGDGDRRAAVRPRPLLSEDPLPGSGELGLIEEPAEPLPVPDQLVRLADRGAGLREGGDAPLFRAFGEVEAERIGGGRHRRGAELGAPGGEVLELDAVRALSGRRPALGRVLGRACVGFLDPLAERERAGAVIDLREHEFRARRGLARGIGGPIGLRRGRIRVSGALQGRALGQFFALDAGRRPTLGRFGSLRSGRTAPAAS